MTLECEVLRVENNLLQMFTNNGLSNASTEFQRGLDFIPRVICSVQTELFGLAMKFSSDFQP